MCGCGLLHTETEGSAHPGLPRRLVRFSPVGRQVEYSQVPCSSVIWNAWGLGYIFPSTLCLSSSKYPSWEQVSTDAGLAQQKWPKLALYIFPLIALLPQVIRRVSEDGCSVLLAEPVVVPRDGATAVSSHLADFPEEGPPFPGEGMIWHLQSKLWSLHLWPLNRSLCAFPQGEGIWNEDPSSYVSLVLSFLQEQLDKGHTPSTLKVYVASRF